MSLSRLAEVGLWLSSGSLLFLSLWVVVPAPTFALLPLSIGVPELSPGLWLLNGVVLVLAMLGILAGLSAGPLLLGLLALGLFSVPLLQVPMTVRQVEQTLQPFVSAAPTAPPRQPIQLWDSLAGIPLDPIREPQEQVFAQPDGIPLKLRIYMPPVHYRHDMPQGLYPGVLVIYGGAWQRGSPEDNALFNHALAAQGYTVIALDYRHAPRYRFPTQLEDVRAGVRFVQEHAQEWGVDPERMAVMGRSAGGQLALMLAYRAEPQPTPLRAVIVLYGPVDLAAGYADPPRPDPINTRAVLEAFLGGSPATRPDLYRQASPIHQVRPQLPPTLLIYGGRDHVVQPKYGQLLAERLQQMENKALLIRIPWADHAFDAVPRGLSSQMALYATERFLASTLKVPAQEPS
ncbi:alpha/beta hydrolase [Synechococcus sp. Nb3U1]|uniref:alpha/beta hydrolase n=1 Tax=Synechococcus sp. Nb3U1 TaxID=1914529 RepID=UPI001F2CBD45|nr:alpha/beta hydrolase [Synechococcus sp. Nb3U1]MCF2971904.1 alpha/beta hydrolase [Synechococcus sp. Nb3U1]